MKFAAAAVAATLLLATGPSAISAQEIEVRPTPGDTTGGEIVGTHTVRRGDTLWDLAARFLRDPLRWTTLYEWNTDVVEDPHWIFPGEQLRVPGAVARVDRARVERAEDVYANLGVDEDGAVGRYPAGSIFLEPRGGGVATLQVDAGPPQPVVTLSDFRRAPLLVPAGALGPEGRTARVMEENPLGLNLPTSARMNVDVILDLGGLDPAVGDTLKAIRWGRAEEPYGRVVRSMALLEVNHRWADSARARVVQMFSDYRVGDPVVEPDPYTLDPAARPIAADVDITGRVVGFDVPQVLLGPGEWLFLDIGRDDGARPGDEVAIFSRDERAAIVSAEADALMIARIVHVTDRTSTAHVIRVRDPGAAPGDPVRRVRRMVEQP